MKKLIAVLALVLAISQISFANSPEEIAKKFAPVIYQDVDTGGLNGLDDYLTSYDFDGNINGRDNWNNLANFIQGVPAYVYYAVTETATHWFIFYGFFHPRDWDNEYGINMAKFPGLTAQHENDLEGVLVVVTKLDPDDIVQVICTMAHNEWYNYPVAGNIKVKEGYDDNRVNQNRPKFLGTHPIVLVQAEGHGVYADELSAKDAQRLDPSTDYFLMGIKLWDEPETGFPDGIGIIYHIANEPELALPIKKGDPNTENQIIGYQLLHLNDLWQYRSYPCAFTSDGHFIGQHDGYDDPDPKVNDPRNDNLACAPWVWQDEDGEPGEIFFDPAKFVARRFEGFEEFSFAYTSNNPPWIKKDSQAPVYLWVQGDSLDRRTVVIDKDIKPSVGVKWDTNIIPTEEVGVVVFLWNGQDMKYPRSSREITIGYVCPAGWNSPGLSGNLGYYVSEGGYLVARLYHLQEGAERYNHFYSDTLWVQVRPHPTSFRVDQKTGSDQTGNGSKSQPYATIWRALDRVNDYYEAPKRYRQTIVDTIFVGPGVYNESPDLSFAPVHLIGSGAHNCIIGDVEWGMYFLKNGSSKTSSIQGFRITSHIWAYEIRVKIFNNVFTKDNWSEEFLPCYISGSAILIEDCASYVEITANTFEAGGLMLINSSPKIYSNVFSGKCGIAIWGYDEESYPTIGGSKSRANSFLANSSIRLQADQIVRARYNWWETTDEEEINYRTSDNVDYHYYLKSPPGAEVGVQVPEEEKGDFDNNQAITLSDFVFFINHFDSKPGDPNWDPRFDINFDSHVDLADFQIFVDNFGKKYGQTAKPVIEQVASQISAPLLFPCYPNPSNSQVHFKFFIPTPGPVHLKVFNSLGQPVRALLNESRPPGWHQVVWAGQDNSGQPVASGVYFCEFKAGDFQDVKSLTLIR